MFINKKFYYPEIIKMHSVSFMPLWSRVVIKSKNAHLINEEHSILHS